MDENQNEARELTPKERVQQELVDLKNKILRLTAVLYGETLQAKGISKDMMRLMEDQLRVMQVYATILQNRLAHWDDEVNNWYHPYNI